MSGAPDRKPLSFLRLSASVANPKRLPPMSEGTLTRKRGRPRGTNKKAKQVESSGSSISSSSRGEISKRRKMDQKSPTPVVEDEVENTSSDDITAKERKKAMIRRTRSKSVVESSSEEGEDEDGIEEFSSSDEQGEKKDYEDFETQEEEESEELEGKGDIEEDMEEDLSLINELEKAEDDSSSEDEMLTRAQRRKLGKKKRLKRLSDTQKKSKKKIKENGQTKKDGGVGSESDFEKDDGKVECTVCYRRLRPGYIYGHPLLKVATCKRCVREYINTEWPKDSDGYDEFCRWSMKASEELWLCEKCTRVFDSNVIKRNLGVEMFEKISKSDDWNCLVCDPAQLEKLNRDWPEYGSKKLNGDGKKISGKYRRHIKKVLNDSELSKEAQRAMKLEKLRIKLLREREEKYAEQGKKYENEAKKGGLVCLNPHHPPFEEPAYVAEAIGKHLKKHQISGVRFLWENIVDHRDLKDEKNDKKGAPGKEDLKDEKVKAKEGKEAMEVEKKENADVIEIEKTTSNSTAKMEKMAKADKNTRTDESADMTSEKVDVQKHEKDQMMGAGKDKIEDTPALEVLIKGSGCILAHLMGLGKTLQSITIITAFLKHKIGRHVMVITPVNVLANWVCEFRHWLKYPVRPKIISMVDSGRTNRERLHALEKWRKTGGVLIIGFEMIRNLCDGKRVTGKMKERFQSLLLELADLVIVDEGHRIKSAKSGLSKVLSQIGTRRRIILTGTPLQNNLLEYFYMIDFVRPNFMGTSKDFRNRFETPILNGQCIDSNKSDVRLMRERAFVLHNKVQGFVHRRGYKNIAHELPNKYVYTLFVSLSPFQKNLYVNYLRGALRKALFNDYHNLNKIWNHPKVLQLAHEEWYEITRKKQERAREELFVVEDEGEQEEEEEEEEEYTSDEEKMKARMEESRKRQEVRNRLKQEKLTQQKRRIEDMLNKQKNGMRHDWFKKIFEVYSINGDDEKLDLTLGPKFQIAMELLKRIIAQGEKAVIFSQSLVVLDLLERAMNEMFGFEKHEHYFRIDGSIKTELRQNDIAEFNEKDSTQHVFLLSTKAGSLGINLVGANHAIIFDSSWNPSHDLQAIFRIYRFGQRKDVFVYRLVSHGTMEQKIYERQLTKRGLALRVVDEQQVQRHFKSGDLQELYMCPFTREVSYVQDLIPKSEAQKEEKEAKVKGEDEREIKEKENEMQVENIKPETIDNVLKDLGVNLNPDAPAPTTVYNPYEKCRKEFSEGSLMWWLLARFGSNDQKKDALQALKAHQEAIKIEQGLTASPAMKRGNKKREKSKSESSSSSNSGEVKKKVKNKKRIEKTEDEKTDTDQDSDDDKSDLEDLQVLTSARKTESQIREAKLALIKTALAENGDLKPTHLIHGFHMPTVLLEHIDTEELNDDERKQALANFEMTVNREKQASAYPSQMPVLVDEDMKKFDPIKADPPPGWPVNPKINEIFTWSKARVSIWMDQRGLTMLKPFLMRSLQYGPHLFFLQPSSVEFRGLAERFKRQFLSAVMGEILSGQKGNIWKVHMTQDSLPKIFFYNHISNHSTWDVPKSLRYDFGLAQRLFVKYRHEQSVYKQQWQQVQAQRQMLMQYAHVQPSQLPALPQMPPHPKGLIQL